MTNLDTPRLWTICESPLGPLTLVGGPGGLTALLFPGRAIGLRAGARRPAAFADATRQLGEYFSGERQGFELALDLGGTPFQRGVWHALLQLRYGATVSYGTLAARVGRPHRVREVAAAIGCTPVPIIVPCHRVVGADGQLTGYRGGLERKRALLELEQLASAGRSPQAVFGQQLSLL